jgi:hypothetical protein
MQKVKLTSSYLTELYESGKNVGEMCKSIEESTGHKCSADNLRDLYKTIGLSLMKRPRSKVKFEVEMDDMRLDTNTSQVWDVLTPHVENDIVTEESPSSPGHAKISNEDF